MSTMKSTTYLTLVLVALLVWCPPGHAASPTMSTTAGSSGVCGGGGDICVPSFDIFGAGPIAPPTVLTGALGLVPGDEITSLSWGADSIFGLARIHFSVDAASVGVPGISPDVASEAAAGEAAADAFFGGPVTGASPNALFIDGDGTITAPAGPFTGFGMVEAPTAPPRDDIDAMSSCNSTTTLAIGIPAFYTLATGSPTLTTLGAGSADVLRSVAGVPSIFALSGTLGLVGGDSIDALAVALGLVVFSLAPGSPTLGSIPAGPEDILLEGAILPSVFVSGASIGLGAGDNLDALDIAPDVDSDFVNDSCDNCSLLANNDQNDGDGDLLGDACDTCTDSDGDGFGDPGFPGNSCPDDNCVDVVNPGQADDDGDGLGNDCDLCSNVGGLQNLDFKPRLNISKINSDTDPTNDRIVIKGQFMLDAGTTFTNLDPLTKGARIVVLNSGGGTITDESLVSGPFLGANTAGWAQNNKLTKWIFKDKTGAPANGFNKMIIIDKANKGFNEVRVVVKGKKGTYPVMVGDEPVFATIVLGDQTSADAGECTETDFVFPECDFNSKVNKLKCKR